VRDNTAVRVVPARSMVRATAVAMALGLGGCAVRPCDSVSIVVADKEERSRLDMSPQGFRTTATGRLEEAREPIIAREYWVRSQQGAWFLVSSDQYRLAEPGYRIAVCR
jgi:hypothetical protein